MAKGTRRKHSGAFTAKVAPAAIAGGKTLVALAQQLGVTPKWTAAGELDPCPEK